MAEQLDTMSTVKLDWFQFLLEVSCMSSYIEELWYNETVSCLTPLLQKVDVASQILLQLTAQSGFTPQFWKKLSLCCKKRIRGQWHPNITPTLGWPSINFIF